MAKQRALATQALNEADLNEMNRLMREQGWYQDWFKGRGLNPNKVKLNESQRNELATLAASQGLTLDGRMKFDEAGNVNQKGGFAGMPTWGKVLTAAAPVAGAMFIPGIREATLGQLGGIFGAGGGGVGASGTGSGLTAASNFAATQIPQAVGGTVAASTATGAGMGAGKVLGGLKDFFLGGNGKRGIDPTTLLLGGLSMLGGGDDELNSFKGTAVDPVNRMAEALDAIKAMSNQLSQRGPTRMRPPTFEPPAPVEIPGLGFQIGGGLGKDPALFGQLDLQTQFPDLFGGQGGAVPRDTNFADLFNKRKTNQNG